MADDSPRKYVVSGNKILWSGPWDMPWFKDNDWPCTELDLRDSVNSLWPKSPLWTGICHQRALNWIYGVYMTRMAQSFRKIIGVLEGPDGVPLSLEDLDKALYGDGDQGNIEVVTIKWKGQEGVQLKNIMQELVMTSSARRSSSSSGESSVASSRKRRASTRCCTRATSAGRCARRPRST
jgi:hypothetical protein